MTADHLPAVVGDEGRPPADVHYEIELDQQAEPGAVPELVDQLPAAPALGVRRLPVIPDHLRSRRGVLAACQYQGALIGHRVMYHGVRSPRYLLLALWWALVGVLVTGERIRSWWWVAEQAPLRSDAVIAGDSREWLRLHKEAKATRQFRGAIVAGGAVAVAAGCAALALAAPWWAQALACIVALPLLATAGRPADRRIMSAAVVAPRFRKLNPDIVLRAYYAAKLGDPEKPGQEVTFGSTMQRDGDGSRVLIDLPYGRGLDDAIAARPRIASGLDVTASQVFIHRDPTSHRRHVLWVADQDPLAVPVGRTPLLACKPTDIWKPAPMGLDERGQLVALELMWQSVLIGALPRQGKTFVARLLALYAALDPYVRLDVFDCSGKPDWRKFALVADSCAFGLTPTRAGLPPEIFLATLERIRADVEDRYHRLSAMPTAICPLGKLTRQIARDPDMGMPVRVLAMDEFQEWFTLGPISKEIAELLVYLSKVAPAAGVILVDATQKPSGIGTGNVGTQFTTFRDNHQVRFSLRTSSYTVSEMVLGSGAYGEGLDSSTLLPQYKGVGILRGATDASPVTRTHLADADDAERILTAARVLRQQARTLSGMALGEADSVPAVSIADDVLAVLGDLPGMHWAPLAGLLAARFPDRHRDATAETVSALCQAAGIPSVQVKYLGRNTSGCRRADVQKAAGLVGAA